jgi:hypothetical protein
MIDNVMTGGVASFREQVATLAAQLAHSPEYPGQLTAKVRELAEAEDRQPLASYRAAELAIMRQNFSGRASHILNCAARSSISRSRPERRRPSQAQDRAGSFRYRLAFPPAEDNTRPWPASANHSHPRPTHRAISANWIC